MNEERGQPSFAVGLPNIGIFGDPSALVSLARDAEAAGWDGVFIWDHLLHSDPSWPVADPTVTIGAIAAATSRVRVGVMVTPLARRRPEKVAREVASLQTLANGRAIFGAGLGGFAAELTAFGGPGDPRVRGERLDEALEVVTGLWSGQEVTYRGQHFTVEGVQMTPSVEVPVWIAGTWPNPRPFRRAARHDGVFPIHADYGRGTMMPPAVLREVVDRVRQHRDPALGDFDVALEGDSAPGDRAKVDSYVEVGLTWWVEALGWWRGDLDAARARIHAGPP